LNPQKNNFFKVREKNLTKKNLIKKLAKKDEKKQKI